MVVSCLNALTAGLAQVSPTDLESLHVDLSTQGGGRYCRSEVERALRELGLFVGNASALRSLAVRLASFDAAMERLRLGPASWEALIRGLSGLAQHQRLHSLELSYMTIKASQATQEPPIEGGLEAEVEGPSSPGRASGSSASSGGGRVLRRAATSPGRNSGRHEGPFSGSPAKAPAAERPLAPCSSATPRTFLEVLGQLTELEELRLTHDEIFGATAQLLPSILTGMPRLKRVDLTRNHIPKQVMQEVRAAMPQRVKLAGDDQQTFFFY